MKIEDVKALPTDELKEKLYALKEELFNLRRKKAVGQLEHGEQIRGVRKDIARVNTVLKERELAKKSAPKTAPAKQVEAHKVAAPKKVEVKKEAK
ncbi:MAG: 50S ribosomal protein L29 [Bacilli bacterium]|nr:50S ribosomal protein L29 [Bacilli bacterium]